MSYDDDFDIDALLEQEEHENDSMPLPDDMGGYDEPLDEAALSAATACVVGGKCACTAAGVIYVGVIIVK